MTLFWSLEFDYHWPCRGTVMLLLSDQLCCHWRCRRRVTLLLSLG